MKVLSRQLSAVNIAKLKITKDLEIPSRSGRNIANFLSEQSHNLDEALANIINNMHISNQDNNFLPKGWYEKLWKDFQILERDYDSLNIRFKFGLDYTCSRNLHEAGQGFGLSVI
ncbi:hypothetical protein RhiirC2_718376 [Rhizophagus irregularis]|uniref:Uncharacterized protein n=1 Tax=Rhizophagus irregularis TaxID=588596 RepID=A0A2N1MIP7_9GLOM|nr:hypothetical protein RhiirC2_718376 [Rhizophagus irregularis]